MCEFDKPCKTFASNLYLINKRLSSAGVCIADEDRMLVFYLSHKRILNCMAAIVFISTYWRFNENICLSKRTLNSDNRKLCLPGFLYWYVLTLELIIPRLTQINHCFLNYCYNPGYTGLNLYNICGSSLLGIYISFFVDVNSDDGSGNASYYFFSFLSR